MKLPFNNSVAIAVGIAAIVAIWLLSGIFSEKEVAASHSVVDTNEKHNVSVLTSKQSAHDHADVITLFGQTEANRDVELKAQTAGRIQELLIEKGTFVKQGDVIARMALEDRNRRLKSAQAAVRFRELEYDASRTLSQKSFRSQTKLAEADSLLNAARADLESITRDIEHTEIKAPFDGYLEETSIEVGDYVDVGNVIAHVVDLSPIVVSAEIPEHEISKVKDGQTAQAILNNGQSINGVVRFVANTSSSSTRTFRLEMEAENPDQSIPAGLTAKLHLNTGTHPAYLVSPAVLTLSDEGVVGLKSVDSENRVVFHTVKLLEDTPEGIWITGLPDEINLIARGQEYVKSGQTVTPVAMESQASTQEQEPAPSLAKAQGE